MDSSPVALISIKSFGDFIIARWALRHVASSPSRVIRLVAGEHLRPLSTAMDRDDSIQYVEHGEEFVPSLFDAKKRGMLRAALSAVRLRRVIGNLVLPSKTTLVFDRVGPRERFVAGSFATTALPVRDNIYLSYCALLDVLPSQDCTTPADPSKLAKAGIFPGSRMAAKHLPASIVEALVDVCRRHSLEAQVFVLDGEQETLRNASFDLTIVPRTFAAMADAVRSSTFVVSADSMPAHLAEYFGQPVFVVSPVDNRYWLPLSCLVSNRWSTFADAGRGCSTFDRFLE